VVSSHVDTPIHSGHSDEYSLISRTPPAHDLVWYRHEESLEAAHMPLPGTLGASLGCGDEVVVALGQDPPAECRGGM
jgi:hypothetical protein